MWNQYYYFDLPKITVGRARTTKNLVAFAYPVSYLTLVKVPRLIGPFWKVSLLAKKIPCIPPRFENNEYIKNFKNKVELFNSFFCKPVLLN